MLRIFGIVKSRAARAIWMAEELGIPYERVAVDYRGRETRTPAFLALNPLGHIPVIDDDGLVLSESVAITLYLARRHPEAPAAPRGLAEEGRTLTWSFFAVNEVESHALTLLMHGREMPAERRDAERVARSRGAIRPPLAALSLALSGQGPMAVEPGRGTDWLLGDRFTVADLNLAAMLEWIRAEQALLDEFPVVNTWLARCFARPSHQRLRDIRRNEP